MAWGEPVISFSRHADSAEPKKSDEHMEVGAEPKAGVKQLTQRHRSPKDTEFVFSTIPPQNSKPTVSVKTVF